MSHSPPADASSSRGPVTDLAVVEYGPRRAATVPIPEDVSVVQLLGAARRHWPSLLLLPLLLGAATAAYVATQPRAYVTSASLVPQSGDASRSRLAGLAAQFGVSVGGGGESRQSPAFYADLIQSRGILQKLVESPLVGDATGRRATPIEWWSVPGDTPAQRREAAIGRARASLAVSRGRETGIVTFSFQAPTPHLAAAASARIIELVNEFDARTRQQQGTLERQFVQERLDEARGDLRRAEERLADFDRRNRVIDYSPDLMIERGRLQREQMTQQQVYTSLAQGAAQARIDALRNSPAIMVVDPPYEPSAPVPRQLAVKTAVALVAGFLIALVVAILREVLPAAGLLRRRAA